MTGGPIARGESTMSEARTSQGPGPAVPADPRLMALLHARLDGELTPAEALELEERVAGDPVARELAGQMDRLSEFAASAQVAAPPGLAGRVLSRLGDEPAGATAVSWLRGLFAPPVRGIPALVRAAALVILALLLARWSIPVSGGPGRAPDVPGTAENGVVPWRFEFEAPAAHTVCLVGDFNDWKVCEAPLVRDDQSGRWVLQIDLPRGRHEYMFVVDDSWVTDPGADMKRDDGYGNQNAVIYL